MTDALFDIAPSWADGGWIAKRVNNETAQDWLARYHYLGTAGTAAHRFGVYPPGSDMIACVVVSEPSNAHGMREKFPALSSYDGNLEITRVAVHPDAPKNAASRAVAVAIAELHQSAGTEWLFSYADTGQGHHGGIYQALNAVYVGISAARPGFTLDGKPIHPRTVVARFGSQSKAKIEELQRAGVDIQPVSDANSAKHTYIIPCGGPKARREIRSLLACYAKPYPKRAEEGSRVSRPATSGEGGVRFPGSAPVAT